MSTLTNFKQLKAYWWNSINAKTQTVQVKLRDLRPRNSTFEQYDILIRLARKALAIAAKRGDLKELKIQLEKLEQLTKEFRDLYPDVALEAA